MTQTMFVNFADVEYFVSLCYSGTQGGIYMIEDLIQGQLAVLIRKIEVLANSSRTLIGFSEIIKKLDGVHAKYHQHIVNIRLNSPQSGWGWILQLELNVGAERRAKIAAEFAEALGATCREETMEINDRGRHASRIDLDGCHIVLF